MILHGPAGGQALTNRVERRSSSVVSEKRESEHIRVARGPPPWRKRHLAIWRHLVEKLRVRSRYFVDFARLDQPVWSSFYGALDFPQAELPERERSCQHPDRADPVAGPARRNRKTSIRP